ncbi:hypothetical protein, partial [Gimesia chilikensis]|uniref:hypothetical protein n=1 Tax=Gimesia chilikensis TaxID=2605989 RepID=UPI003A9310F4
MMHSAQFSLSFSTAPSTLIVDIAASLPKRSIAGIPASWRQKNRPHLDDVIGLASRFTTQPLSAGIVILHAESEGSTAFVKKYFKQH